MTHRIPPVLSTEVIISNNNINDTYSTTSTVHRGYYLKQQCKQPTQYHQCCPQTVLSLTTIKTTHTVPLVLSTEGIISKNNENDAYSSTSTVHRGYYHKQQYKQPTQYHQYSPQKVLSQTTIKTTHRVPPVLSTQDIISNNNKNDTYSTTSTVHRGY